MGALHQNLKKRDLRQGDTLSPFLFIIVMEGLHMALNDGLDANMFHGVKVDFLVHYLLPIGLNMSRIMNWQPLTNHFKVSEAVVKSLKSLRASFFWGSSEDSKKLAWVKWSNILASLNNDRISVLAVLKHQYVPFIEVENGVFSIIPNSYGYIVLRAIYVMKPAVNVGRTKAEFDALIFDIASLEPEELVDSDNCIWSLSHDDKFSGLGSILMSYLSLPYLQVPDGVRLSLGRFFVPFLFLMWRVGSLVSVMARLKGKEGPCLRYLCCFPLDLMAV
ncbi:hypothetical protein Tco_0396102 [Tanacetum coccineum]